MSRHVNAYLSALNYLKLEKRGYQKKRVVEPLFLLLPKSVLTVIRVKARLFGTGSTVPATIFGNGLGSD